MMLSTVSIEAGVEAVEAAGAAGRWPAADKMTPTEQNTTTVKVRRMVCTLPPRAR
jgi:hypothetical protein